MVPSQCRDALRASLYRHHGLHRRDAASKSAPGESRFEFDSSSPPRRRPQGVSTVGGPAGPTFQTPSKAVRRELYEGYAWFVAAYREASEKLRDGSRMVSFPIGSFPPPLPFVAG